MGHFGMSLLLLVGRHTPATLILLYMHHCNRQNISSTNKYVIVKVNMPHVHSIISLLDVERVQSLAIRKPSTMVQNTMLKHHGFSLHTSPT